MSGFLVLLCVVVLVLINVPIAVALGVVALIAMVATQGTDSLPNLAIVTYQGATSFPLIAIPLFILAGAIMNTSGISQAADRRLQRAVRLDARRARARVERLTSMFFAEISGSAVADVAALGSILIPAMKAQAATPGRSAAAVMSSSATLAIIIPPSIPMILYAVMAGDVGRAAVRRGHRARADRAASDDGHGHWFAREATTAASRTCSR